MNNLQEAQIPVHEPKQKNPFDKKGNGNKPTFTPPAPTIPQKQGFYQLLIPIAVGDGIKWFIAEQYFDNKGNMVGIEPADDELKGFIHFQGGGLPIQFIDEKHRLYEKRMEDVKASHALLNGETVILDKKGRLVKQQPTIEVVYVESHHLTRFQKSLFFFMLMSILVMGFHIAQMGGM